jgi:hypothetical protein
MASLYKKVYISVVDSQEIADKEIVALARCGHDVGIDIVVEEGTKRYKVYYNAYAGEDAL